MGTASRVVQGRTGDGAGDAPPPAGRGPARHPGAHPGSEAENARIAGEFGASMALLSDRPAPTVANIMGQGDSGGTLDPVVIGPQLTRENATYAAVPPSESQQFSSATPAYHRTLGTDEDHGRGPTRAGRGTPPTATRPRSGTRHPCRFRNPIPWMLNPRLDFGDASSGLQPAPPPRPASANGRNALLGRGARRGRRAPGRA